jgi:hypothetical protein
MRGPSTDRDLKDRPGAASTCSTRAGSDSSVDSTCTSNLGKRHRVDAPTSGGCSSPTSKLFCHEDLREKTAPPPHRKKPAAEECPEARTRQLALESGSQDADDANTRSVLRTMMTQEREQRAALLVVGDRLRMGSSIIYMVPPPPPLIAFTFPLSPDSVRP